MFNLHWFHDISMDTKVRDVGWTYIILAVLIIFTIIATIWLIKEWKR